MHKTKTCPCLETCAITQAHTAHAQLDLGEPKTTSLDRFYLHHTYSTCQRDVVFKDKQYILSCLLIITLLFPSYFRFSLLSIDYFLFSRRL